MGGEGHGEVNRICHKIMERFGMTLCVQIYTRLRNSFCLLGRSRKYLKKVWMDSDELCVQMNTRLRNIFFFFQSMIILNLQIISKVMEGQGLQSISWMDFDGIFCADILS